MIETIEYNCKFCGVHHVFKCDVPEAVEARFDIVKMRQILTCNRCADHESERRALEKKIVVTAEWLKNWRVEINGQLDRSYTQDKIHSLRGRINAIEVRAEEMLTVLTKRFANCVCAFKQVATIWESDFVELIMKTPQNAYKHLIFYRHNVAK